MAGMSAAEGRERPACTEMRGGGGGGEEKHVDMKGVGSRRGGVGERGRVSGGRRGEGWCETWSKLCGDAASASPPASSCLQGTDQQEGSRRRSM